MRKAKTPREKHNSILKLCATRVRLKPFRSKAHLTRYNL